MNTPTALLDQVASDLDRLLGADVLSGLSDADRLTVLEAAGAALRRMEAVVVETMATAAPADVAHSAGCRAPNELLQRTLRVESRTVAQVMKASTLVRRETDLTSGAPLPARWPALRQALLDGVIGVTGLLAATAPIEAVHDRIGTAERWKADAVLADVARGLDATDTNGDTNTNTNTDTDTDTDTDGDASRGSGPVATPEDLKVIAHAITAQLDPDGAEPAEQQAMRKRYLSLGRLRDGVYSIRGNLLPEVYAQLQLILDAQLNPKTDGPAVPAGVRFEPSNAHDGSAGDAVMGASDEEDPFNSDPRAVIDGRTRPQKQHDALAATLGIAARHHEMPSLGGAAPTLVVHLEATPTIGEQPDVGGADANPWDAPTHPAGTGTGAGAGAGTSFEFATSPWAHIPGVETPLSPALARHTGCTGAIQRVFTEHGRIVGITVTDRVFTVHQRRAITLRDHECLIPGCHVPASWCEIHHVHEHARGGPTHTDNGVPLCWWHHRSLDYSGWEIRMTDGLPEIRGPAWWDPTQQWRTPRPSLPNFALT